MAESAALFELRTTLESTLSEAFGEIEYTPDGNYAVRYETALIVIKPSDAGSTTAVWIVAPMVAEADCNAAALADFVVSHNATYAFGRFALEPASRMVNIDHHLHGSPIDGMELVYIILSVGMMAARFGDDVARLSGGRNLIGQARPKA